ncbi:MAG: hypothetical protein ACLTYW_00240 [Collinsella sp.]
MACVELPKDACGRAIPLDTGTLYKKNGVAKYIYHYDYDPRDKAWYVETDDGRVAFPNPARPGRQLGEAAGRP